MLTTFTLVGSDNQELELLSKFVIAQIIAQNLSRLVENGMAADLYFKRDILPSLEKDLVDLEEYSLKMESVNTEVSLFLKEWIPKYKKESLKLLENVLDIAKWHSNRSNIELNNILSLYAHKDQSLSSNALAVALSATSNAGSSVLLGMRNEKQVDEAIGALNRVLLTNEQLEGLLMNPYLSSL